MKGAILIAAGVLGGAYMFARPAEEVPTADVMVAKPRTQLYSELAPLYEAIEQKAAHVTTVTGTPPIPVKFHFAHVDGEMLDLSAVAGFRRVEIKLWMTDGARPGETRLRMMFDPESLIGKSGDPDPVYALRNTLEQVDEQFVEGKRITALFGGRATAS
jgi:hypothetical protein